MLSVNVSLNARPALQKDWLKMHLFVFLLLLPEWKFEDDDDEKDCKNMMMIMNLVDFIIILEMKKMLILWS